MENQYSGDGLKITKSMLGNATQGVGSCLRCRAMLDDAELLGFPMPAVRAQLDEWQPKLEGLIAYNAASQGVGNG